MGFAELIRSIGSIFSSFSAMKELLVGWRPHLLILVDYPDFNLRLARFAHSRGVRVLYYIPPKVWAWRAGRIRQLAAYVDHIAAIFPFEREFYKARGYSALSYVGHPLIDRCSELRLAPARDETLLILPGSRTFEVERILPPSLRVLRRLQESYPNLKGKVIVAPNMSIEWIRGVAAGVLGAREVDQIEWSREDALAAMGRARVGLLKSGTCNLEGALAGLPFISLYSGSWFSNLLVSLFVPLKEYSPVNIMRSGTVREFMQVRINEEALERELRKLVAEGEERSRVELALTEVRARLSEVDWNQVGAEGGTDVAGRVAALALSLSKGLA
jgi:lipid-A-disaccharide synthase